MGLGLGLGLGLEMGNSMSGTSNEVQVGGGR